MAVGMLNPSSVYLLSRACGIDGARLRINSRPLHQQTFPQPSAVVSATANLRPRTATGKGGEFCCKTFGNGRLPEMWTRVSCAARGETWEDEEESEDDTRMTYLASDSENHDNKNSTVAQPGDQSTARTKKRHGIMLAGLRWVLGPLALLLTGAIPALWLPSPSLFAGSTTAGLLALAGLDGTFNLGATAFLLMADSCGGGTKADKDKSFIPSGYKAWSFLVNLFGLLAPAIAIAASWKGTLGPTVGVVPVAALVGPYMTLLLVQWLAESLVWQWQSPVWPVLPLVYQAYRILQLTRGVELGGALSAPPWLVEAVKGLVSWWVFVLGMQIMWIAWLVGNMQTRATAINK